jgi:hypothetical protein
MFRPILALTILCASGALPARAGNEQVQPGTPAQIADATKKEKERFLKLLDDVEPLARWMTDAPGFVAVLDDVRAHVAEAKASALTPLHEYEPYFDHLEATFARMRTRMDPVQAAAELCDPARSEDLFQLYLDALDADGQREVNARICEKLASVERDPGSPPQLCLATHLVFLSAKAMRDLVALCDPGLGERKADGSEGFDQLRSQLAGVNAELQESVRNTRRDLTQVMSVIAGHVADVSSVNSTSIENTIQASQDHAFRLEIEKTLDAGKPYGVIYLPEAYGGQLETVRRIVIETIGNVRDSGELHSGASAKLAAADEQLNKRHYKRAFQLYSEAYKAAIGMTLEP